MAVDDQSAFDPEKRKLMLRGIGEGTAEPGAFQISSVLVQARPEDMAGIKERFAPVSAVEFHEGGGPGQLIATIETRIDQEMVEIIDLMEQTPGVMSVALVYHQIEEGDDHA